MKSNNVWRFLLRRKCPANLQGYFLLIKWLKYYQFCNFVVEIHSAEIEVSIHTESKWQLKPRLYLYAIHFCRSKFFR